MLWVGDNRASPPPPQSLSEPTTAAIAYGLDKSADSNQPKELMSLLRKLSGVYMMESLLLEGPCRILVVALCPCIYPDGHNIRREHNHTGRAHSKRPEKRQNAKLEKTRASLQTNGQ
ncbi:hypothetical protein Tco_1262128 [Tanacetum coccineum]